MQESLHPQSRSPALAPASRLRGSVGFSTSSPCHGHAVSAATGTGPACGPPSRSAARAGDLNAPFRWKRGRPGRVSLRSSARPSGKAPASGSHVSVAALAATDAGRRPPTRAGGPQRNAARRAAHPGPRGVSPPAFLRRSGAAARHGLGAALLRPGGGRGLRRAVAAVERQQCSAGRRRARSGVGSLGVGFGGVGGGLWEGGDGADVAEGPHGGGARLERARRRGTEEDMGKGRAFSGRRRARGAGDEASRWMRRRAPLGVQGPYGGLLWRGGSSRHSAAGGPSDEAPLMRSYDIGCRPGHVGPHRDPCGPSVQRPHRDPSVCRGAGK